MSDGGRRRASLGVESWKSSQKWRAQRSAVRYAPARAIELVAQQLIGRASRGTEAAVNAFAQNGLGRLAVACAFEIGGGMGLHVGGLNLVKGQGTCGRG